MQKKVKGRELGSRFQHSTVRGSHTIVSISDHGPGREVWLFCQVRLRHRKVSELKAEVPIPNLGSSLQHPPHHPRWILGKSSELANAW